MYFAPLEMMNSCHTCSLPWDSRTTQLQCFQDCLLIPEATGHPIVLWTPTLRHLRSCLLRFLVLMLACLGHSLQSRLSLKLSAFLLLHLAIYHLSIIYQLSNLLQWRTLRSNYWVKNPGLRPWFLGSQMFTLRHSVLLLSHGTGRSKKPPWAIEQRKLCQNLLFSLEDSQSSDLVEIWRPKDSMQVYCVNNAKVPRS